MVARSLVLGRGLQIRWFLRYGGNLQGLDLSFWEQNPLVERADALEPLSWASSFQGRTEGNPTILIVDSRVEGDPGSAPDRSIEKLNYETGVVLLVQVPR